MGSAAVVGAASDDVVASAEADADDEVDYSELPPQALTKTDRPTAIAASAIFELFTFLLLLVVSATISAFSLATLNPQATVVYIVHGSVS